MNMPADPKRQMAAEFLAMANEHAAMITTSDLYTENFVRAFKYAEHMVAGGGYSGGESQLVWNQLKKLERHFNA